MKPTIAYFCSQYPAISHTFILREIKQLTTLGYTVKPFSMRPGKVLDGAGSFEREQLQDTFCIHRQSFWRKIGSQCAQFARHPIGYLAGLTYAIRLQGGHWRASLWAVFHFLEAAILARAMRKGHIEHVHVHFAGSEAAIAHYAARAFGISYSLTLHGPDVFYRTESQHLAQKLAAARFIVCISYFARGQVLRLLGFESLEKLHIVRCGVDPDRFQPVKRTQDRPFTIVCTGRLTSTKGQALLVQSCADLKEQGYEFRCVFIGGGDEADRLSAMVASLQLQDMVTLTGPLPQEAVHQQLGHADMFVLPSFAEGVPVVLMEAMSMAIPTVGTRIAGIAELIEHGVNGFLIHSGDLRGLTDMMKTIIEAPSHLLTLTERGRETIVNTYDVRKNVQGLGRIFDKYLQSKS